MRRKYLQVAGDEATEEFYPGDGRMRLVIVRKNLHARLRGVGLVPANYEPKSKLVTMLPFAKHLHSRSLGQSAGAKTGNALELRS